MSQQAIWWASEVSSRDYLSRFFSDKNHILLIADSTAYSLCGAAAIIDPLVQHAYVTRLPIEINVPEAKALVPAIQAVSQSRIDCILAVGGGTTIDMAKLVRYYGGNAELEWVNASSLPEQSPLKVPLLAIPTTSGSGSEATHFAVVYAGGEKVSVAHPSILPEYVYLDPAFTNTLPQGQRVASGLDALCQGIESYWAVNSSSQSKTFARSAIKHAWAHLSDYVLHPGQASVQGMSMASHLAGKAINLTKTTACHALSYTMTYNYGIPHGVAVAISLGPMLLYNAGVTEGDVQDPRGVAYVREALEDIVALLGFETPEHACKGIQDILDGLIGGHTLSSLGIKEEHVQSIVDGVNIERLGNNPRGMTRQSVLELLRDLT